MKRVYRLISVLVIGLLLVACSGTDATSETSEKPILDESYDDALPVSFQLALGILKLEGTDLAISADQINSLLTLWQAYQSLSESDSAALSEVSSVERQILNSLTDSQMQAILNMKLTTADAEAFMVENGGQLNGVGPGDRTGAMEGGGGNQRPSGVEGMISEGGGMMGGGVEGLDPAAMETRMAETGTDVGEMQAMMQNRLLVNAVIRLLSEK